MTRVIEIDHLKIGGRHRPVFIAEIGINHGGNLDLLYHMAERCIQEGADIIKTQYHIPSQEMITDHPWYELMYQCDLTIEDIASFKTFVESNGAVFLCTPFCELAAAELNGIDVSAFKTGSGEANHTEFLNFVAAFNKPMIISTGMSTREELIQSLDYIRNINRNIILMNCTSNYPSTPYETRLRRIDWLQTMFSLPVGQSDHSPTISTALGAIARGACAIEKHVTVDKEADGPDHSVSLTPSEFGQMVKMGIEIWEGIQQCTETAMTNLVKGEAELREIANHSLVAADDLSVGQRLSKKNLSYRRPGTGIPARFFRNALAHRMKRNVSIDTVITMDDLILCNPDEAAPCRMCYTELLKGV